jgi:zinc protease
MKRLLALTLFVVVGWPFAAQATDVKKVVSPGGIEAWLVSEDSIPLITMVVAFDGGARRDPAGKEALAVMTAGLLNEGAGDMDAQAFKRRLDEKAIRLGASAELDAVFASVSTLVEHRAEAFELLRLALNSPRFDPDAVERVRAQLQAVLKREAEDPSTIASRAWNAAALGGHPYGRSENGSAESVTAITRDDILAYAKDNLTRDRLKIAVVGRITPEELAPALDQIFSTLPATSTPESVPLAQLTGQGKTTLIARDIPQSVVVFGAPGLMRKDPDFDAAQVMNYILGGGGFSSRLMEEVREKRGLAYGVSTSLSPLRFGALYIGQVGTDNARAGESLDLIKAEIKRLGTEGPTQKEVDDAKTYITGSFALRLDSNAKIANFLLACQIYDLGIDYINTRNAGIEKVTIDDVKRVATKLLDPAKFAFTVVGKPQGITSN